jgi:hypothetical protein
MRRHLRDRLGAIVFILSTVLMVGLAFATKNERRSHDPLATGARVRPLQRPRCTFITIYNAYGSGSLESCSARMSGGSPPARQPFVPALGNVTEPDGKCRCR